MNNSVKFIGCGVIGILALGGIYKIVTLPSDASNANIQESLTDFLKKSAITLDKIGNIVSEVIDVITELKGDQK